MSTFTHDPEQTATMTVSESRRPLFELLLERDPVMSTYPRQLIEQIHDWILTGDATSVSAPPMPLIGAPATLTYR
jgi:hypothetical protein